ncbi:MAG: DNA glycosylase AlkZ-like family protein, partial [Acidimicrobiales bacterium]
LLAGGLGEAPSGDRGAALEPLPRRPFAGHGPATDRDLARWAGLPLRDVRTGLSAIAAELNDLGGGLVALAGAPVEAEQAPARLLGAFDPLLLGWCDREPIVGEDRTLVTSNGVFRPFALVGGRAVASWGLPSGTLTLRPFGRLSPATRQGLGAEAAAVGAYLGIGTPKMVVEPVSR